MRIVFDQNLNAAGAGIAAALLEKQVGVQADPVCSQTVRAFQGSGCEVLVQYDSPADTARVLGTCGELGLKLDTQVTDTLQGSAEKVQKTVRVMACLFQDEQSLKGWAKVKEVPEREREKDEYRQLIIQRSFGAMAQKGSRGMAARKQMAEFMLDSVSQVPANEGAGVKLAGSGIAEPLQNENVLNPEAKKRRGGWMIWLTADRQIIPPESGELEVGFGVNPKEPMVAKKLSLVPEKGSRGCVALSWPGWVARGGQMVEKGMQRGHGGAAGEGAGEDARKETTARARVTTARACWCRRLGGATSTGASRRGRAPASRASRLRCEWPTRSGSRRAERGLPVSTQAGSILATQSPRL